MSRITSADICDILDSKGLEFVSGKWYFKEKEIKDISKWLYRSQGNKDVLAYADAFKSVSDLDNTINLFTRVYGTAGRWKPLPIIEEAKAQAELKPLCLPLSSEQLKIINRLLAPNQQKFFIITGVGGSGKSTFLNLIKQIFDNDFASLSLTDLGNDFKLAEGVDKRLICSDELSSGDLNNDVLKTIISGQDITVNPKFRTPYVAKFQSSFIFCCNKPPKLNISDSGLLRRIVYYGMEKKIEKPDLGMAYAEWTHEDLVNVVAHALAMDMTDWEEDFKADTHKYLLKYNTVYLFRDCESYTFYKMRCMDAGYRPFSLTSWQEIKEIVEDWLIDENF